MRVGEIRGEARGWRRDESLGGQEMAFGDISTSPCFIAISLQIRSSHPKTNDQVEPCLSHLPAIITTIATIQKLRIPSPSGSNGTAKNETPYS